MVPIENECLYRAVWSILCKGNWILVRNYPLYNFYFGYYSSKRLGTKILNLKKTLYATYFCGALKRTVMYNAQ